MITHKYINLYCCNTNKRKQDYPIVIPLEKNAFRVSGGKVDIEYFKILDFIATKIPIICKTYEPTFYNLQDTKTILNSINEREFKIELKNRNIDLKYCMTFNLDDVPEFICKKDKFVSKIVEMSKIKVKFNYHTFYTKSGTIFSNHPYGDPERRIIETRSSRTLEKYYFRPTDYESFFTLEHKYVDGKTRIKLKFTTSIGYCFFKNCFMNEAIDYVSTDMYKMSTVSQLLYRFFILSSDKPFSVESFCKRVGYSYDNNITFLIKKIEGCLNEIMSFGYIKKYDIKAQIVRFYK